METFTAFVKNSTVFDLLTIPVAAGVVLLGLILLVAIRSRLPMYLLLVIAFVPLSLGLFATYLKNREIEKVMATLPESDRVEGTAAGRREAMITTYIGGAGTAASALIAVIGLAIKRSSVN